MAVKYITDSEHFSSPLSTIDFYEYDRTTAIFSFSYSFTVVNSVSSRAKCIHNTCHSYTWRGRGVVETFGSFVVGGNLVVGMVVFLILVIINFIVITKGSERVSEVAARFALDAMPGKQMSIDADLNAGMISEQQARERREKVSREADFYGSMDGASKFVKGDAIAGIIIVLINLIFGIVIGMMQQGDEPCRCR